MEYNNLSILGSSLEKCGSYRDPELRLDLNLVRLQQHDNACASHTHLQRKLIGIGGCGSGANCLVKGPKL